MSFGVLISVKYATTFSSSRLRPSQDFKSRHLGFVLTISADDLEASEV